MKTQLILWGIITIITIFPSKKTDADPGLALKKHPIYANYTEHNPAAMMEENLELSTWMTDNKLWHIGDVNINEVENVNEEKLKIEPWMTDNKLFGIETQEIENETNEEKLTFQTWMTDPIIWKL
jgi:hypothetical protein